MTMTPEKFHELLDEATGAAPPAPHLAADLAAGRSRLRRRTGAVAGGLAAAAVVAIAGGSMLGGSPEAADDQVGYATEHPSATSMPAPTDSPVLRDVIDAAFPTPGDGQLRNIRVQTFLRSWGVQQCGGQGAPLDSTADRFEQDLFPSLDLIREKGFTEEPAESFAGSREDCQIGDEIQTQAPAFEDWRELTSPWHELADTVLRDESLVALKQPMAQCLRQTTGLEVDDEDPAGSFLGAMDGSSRTLQALRQRAAAYADCGASYFGRLEQLLLDARPAMVDEHRELLEDFARQITALGYRP